MNRHIREVAKDLAGAYYEMDRSPDFRVNFPTVQGYIMTSWHKFIDAARQAMGEALMDKNVPEDQKQKIYDALMEENIRVHKHRHRLRAIPQIGTEWMESGLKHDAVLY